MGDRRTKGSGAATVKLSLCCMDHGVPPHSDRLENIVRPLDQQPSRPPPWHARPTLF
jgi:hypothetical protein